MNTADIRRAVLRSLIKRDFGGVARRLALHLKKPEGQINDMLSDPPRKSFGERIARAIEEQYPLPRGFLDEKSHCEQSMQAKESEPEPYRISPRHSKMAMVLAEYYDQLPEDKQPLVEHFVIDLLLDIPEDKRGRLAEILTLFR